MPDITMCKSQICPRRFTCYRSEESGTKPSEYRQSWFVLGEENTPISENDSCAYYYRCAGKIEPINAADHAAMRA